MPQYKLVILANETKGDEHLWELACKQNNQILYRIVDLTKNTWLSDIQSLPFDYLLAKPGGLTSPFKQLYDERIFILSEELNYKIFPTPKEIFIYENKRFLSFWLRAHNIPHPKTDVYYSFEEGKAHIALNKETIVAKTNIGASGSGVKILTSQEEKLNYIKSVFYGKGAPQRSGPNFEKGGLLKRGFHYVLHPAEIKKKLNIYKTVQSNPQKGFVIFQEYIPHDFEWRVVRIGDSFFAHKKLKLGEKASGGLQKGYENPPLSLLSFVKEITDKHGFYSQAVDIFETPDGKYLVNEMQCIFGQSDAYQMKVDNKIGRYIYKNNSWIFEEGDFAKNACYDLRLEFVINQLKNA